MVSSSFVTIFSFKSYYRCYEGCYNFTGKFIKANDISIIGKKTPIYSYDPSMPKEFYNELVDYFHPHNEKLKEYKIDVSSWNKKK